MANAIVRSVVVAAASSSVVVHENHNHNHNNLSKDHKTNSAPSLLECSTCSAAYATDSLERSESFISANVSSSTSIEESKTHVTNADIVCATERTVKSNTALGVLSKKQSPLLKHKKLIDSPNKSFSLRTKLPFYLQDQVKTNHIKHDCASNIDTSAIEATSMPANVANGSRSSSVTKRSNGAMDINRNNGYLRNGTIMTSSNTEKREHLYKILVIGELGTGKTSFIKRYVHQFFSQNYRATIGVDFALKVLNWDANTIVRLQLWDIAGQERFGNMTRVYYKEAVGAFIVFDVTRSGTFDCVSKWKEDLDSKVQLPDGSRIPCILLANKCDQEKQGIVTTPEKMDEYVRENGFVGWFETSAKENINIDEAAKALVNKILLNDKLITAADLADSDKFNLNNQGDQSGADSKTKCSC